MKNYLTKFLTKFYSSEGTNTLISRKTNLNILNAVSRTNKLIDFYFGAINAVKRKPIVTVTANTINIYVFYYMPDKNSSLNINTINNLGETLTKLYKQPVQLRIIRLYYPFLNADILAQYIGLNRQDYKFVNIFNRLVRSVSLVKNVKTFNTLSRKIPSHIVGVKVRLSGRLAAERSRPRFTVQTAEIGTFSKNNLSLIETACYTTKNKKNAYTVKVWINQRANI